MYGRRHTLSIADWAGLYFAYGVLGESNFDFEIT